MHNFQTSELRSKITDLEDLVAMSKAKESSRSANTDLDSELSLALAGGVSIADLSSELGVSPSRQSETTGHGQMVSPKGRIEKHLVSSLVSVSTPPDQQPSTLSSPYPPSSLVSTPASAQQGTSFGRTQGPTPAAGTAPEFKPELASGSFSPGRSPVRCCSVLFCSLFSFIQRFPEAMHPIVPTRPSLLTKEDKKN